jgi:RNA polymerase sigma-70 factor (ECF subfamily)
MKILQNAPILLHASDSLAADPAPVDSDLLEAARAMDQDALIQIFDRYAALLYRYALRLCSDPQLADQIVGDVFARLLDQFAAGLGPWSNLRSYLYQMTYHLVVDETRHAKRRAPLEVLEEIAYEDSAISTVEDRIVFEKVMSAVRTALTSDQQHVIILRFLEEMSLSETALILGKQVNHIKVLQNRAIERLRKSLQENRKNESRLDLAAGNFGSVGFDFAV